METACSQCRTRHLLNDAQIGSRPRVQFRCAKCGQVNSVDVQRRPDQALVMTPLPSFARGEGAGGPGNIIASEYQGLSLPVGRVLTLSVIAGPAKGLVYPISKPRVVLGRAGADVEINDPEISRSHCAIEVKNEVVRLRDRKSVV